MFLSLTKVLLKNLSHLLTSVSLLANLFTTHEKNNVLSRSKSYLRWSVLDKSKLSY